MREDTSGTIGATEIDVNGKWGGGDKITFVVVVKVREQKHIKIIGHSVNFNVQTHYVH